MTFRAYVDSNILICYVEGSLERKEQIRSLLSGLAAEGGRLFSSDILIGECLIGAYRKAPTFEGTYRDLFDDADFMSLVPVTKPTVHRAAILGAELNMKLIDAVHVATAVDLECRVFLTNDRGIRAPAAIEIRPLPDLA